MALALAFPVMMARPRSEEAGGYKGYDVSIAENFAVRSGGKEGKPVPKEVNAA